jgi:predicted nucleotidyltransferase
MRRRLLAKLREYMRSMDRVFESYVEELENLYPRSTIILYGSRARGDHLPYSDYDLLLVLEGVDDKIGEIVRARSIKPHILPLDLMVVDVEEVMDPIWLESLRQGYRILYDGLGLSHRLKQILWSR